MVQQMLGCFLMTSATINTRFNGFCKLLACVTLVELSVIFIACFNTVDLLKKM